MSEPSHEAMVEWLKNEAERLRKEREQYDQPRLPMPEPLPPPPKPDKKDEGILQWSLT